MDIYEELTRLYRRYRGEKRILGKSVCGRDLFAFFIGKHTHPVGISQYAIHGREWITSCLAAAHLERGVPQGGVWLIPLINPDGALLSLHGLSSVTDEARRNFLFSVNGGDDFSLWKANADGVDLNVNFPARYGTGSGNVRHPAPCGYIGTSPLCAPESRALSAFTREILPDYTISWHTKGEEIYCFFHESLPKRVQSKSLARIISHCNGYPVRRTPHSAGGYKDWCIEALKIPAFTVEVGSDERTHPLGLDALEEIVVKNIGVLWELSRKIPKRK